MPDDKSLERRGFDMLLDAYPDWDVLSVKWSLPWVGVALINRPASDCEKYAIWRATGAVYRVTDDEAVHDDPFLVPPGSSYTGSVEGRDEPASTQAKYRWVDAARETVAEGTITITPDGTYEVPPLPSVPAGSYDLEVAIEPGVVYVTTCDIR